MKNVYVSLISGGDYSFAEVKTTYRKDMTYELELKDVIWTFMWHNIACIREEMINETF
jgi:hypothetical protein